MITQIEIDGFKTFKDFKVELAPFQVIVGPNGAGKSNLFDALHLLSELTKKNLSTFFEGLRGKPNEIFTKYPNGKTSERIWIAVEMLLDRKMKDNDGDEIELPYTRFRYEIEIVLQEYENGLRGFHRNHESLYSIPENEDSWSKKYLGTFQRSWVPECKEKKKIIEDSQILSDGVIPFYIINKGNTDSFVAIQTTSIQNSIGFVLSLGGTLPDTLLGRVARELNSFQIFQLDPFALRQPSSTLASRSLSFDGKNLPTTLARIQAEDPFAFHCITLDMISLVPEIIDIEVEKNQERDEYSIYARTTDQRRFSAQLLSDGTLRMLALATLRNDPQRRGVFCLEEPENSVEPLHLVRAAHMLREMATDFNDPQQVGEPLRQVLITTHSPLFVSYPEVRDSLLLAATLSHIDKDHGPMRVTRIVPVLTPDSVAQMDVDTAKENAVIDAYSIETVRKYLETGTLEEARSQFKQAHEDLREKR